MNEPLTSEQVDNEVTCYTPTQVAELCQVTSETVRKWLNEGTLRGVKLDSFWRIKRVDLLTFLNERYGAPNE